MPLLNRMVIKRSLTGIIFVGMFASIFFLMPPLYFSLFLASTLAYILVVEWPLFGRGFLWFLVGSFYIAIPIFSLITLNQSSNYRQLLPLLFSVVFVHDTGAYIVGSLLGNHKIAPKISPAKTWEGLLGGFITTIAILHAIFWYYQKPSSIWQIFLSAGVITLIATAGDLFESWLKRKASLKDSGTLLPGHGGMLDRFDSLLPLAVLLYLFKNNLFF